MKKKWILLVLAGLLSLIFSITRGWAGDLEIIDLLKQKGILTEEEYTNIRAQFDKEQQKQLKPVYKDGFKLETGDKEFSLGFDGKLFADGRFYTDDNHPSTNTFQARLMRIGLKATLYKYYNFRFEGAYDEGSSGSIKDAYFEAKYFPEAVFRAGQFKEPFCLDELTSDTNIDMMERSLVDNLAPKRDIGAMAYGTLFNDRINYGIGGFNGNGESKASDNNDDKDVAARIVLSPFLLQEGSLLQNLHVGGAMTFGAQNNVPDDYTARTEARTPFFKILAKDSKNNILHVSDRIRWGSELGYNYGPFSLKGEYVLQRFTDMQRQGSTIKKDYDINAWHITASYFLTGEEKGWKEGVYTKPNIKHNFDPFKGKCGIGAWEVLFRYSCFDADEDFLKNGIVDATKYTNKASAYTVGLNWYLNPKVMLKFNYVRTNFDDNLPDSKGQRVLDNENVIMTRFQIEF